jgi:hypothetical protein
MTEVVKVGEGKYVSKTVIEKAAAGNQAAQVVLGRYGVSVTKEGDKTIVKQGEKTLLVKSDEPTQPGVFISSGVAKKLQEAGYVSKEMPIQEGAYYKVESIEKLPTPQPTEKQYTPIQLPSEPKVTAGTTTTQSITSQEFYLKGKDVGVKVISPKPLGEVREPIGEFALKIAPYAALGALSAAVPVVGVAVAVYSGYSIGKELGTGLGTSVREKSLTPITEAGKNILKGFVSPENIAFMVGFGGVSLAKTGALKPAPKREYLLEFNKEELVNVGKEGFVEAKGYLIAKEGKKAFVVGEVETALKYTKQSKELVASEGAMNIKLYQKPVETRTFRLLSKEASYNEATKTGLSKFVGETYEERLKIDFKMNLAEGKSEPVLRIEREPKSIVRGTALTKEVVRIEYPEGRIKSQAGFGSVTQAVGLDEQTKMFGKSVDLSRIKVYDLRKETEFKPTKYSPQKTVLDVGIKPNEASVLPAAKELTKFEIGKELTKIEPKQKASVNLVPLATAKSEVKQKQTSIQRINLGVSLRQDVRQRTLTIRKVKLEQQSTLSLEQKQSDLSKQERINIPLLETKMTNIPLLETKIPQNVGIVYRNELKVPKLSVKPSKITLPKLNFSGTETAGYGLYSAYSVKKSKSRKDIYVLADMLTWTMKGFGKKSPLWKAPSSRVKSKFLVSTLTTMRFPLQRGGRRR